MGNALWQFLEVTEELLGGLATTKSSTELHGRRSRASGPSLVLTSWRLPEQTRIQGFICIKKKLEYEQCITCMQPGHPRAYQHPALEQRCVRDERRRAAEPA